MAMVLPMVPVGTNRAAGLPMISAARSSRRFTVGSSRYTSSPTSASNMACRIAGVGLVTVSLRRSIIASETPGRLRSRSEEHTSELQSPCNIVCRLLLEINKDIHLNPSAILVELRAAAANLLSPALRLHQFFHAGRCLNNLGPTLVCEPSIDHDNHRVVG